MAIKSDGYMRSLLKRLVDSGWIYGATVVRVIDGDTVVLRVEKRYELAVDFGFYIRDTIVSAKHAEMSFRLAGINAPETTGVDATTKARGLASKMELERLLSLGPIVATTYKPDKYGRWLVQLQVQEGPLSINVNQALIEGGFAVPYMEMK